MAPRQISIFAGENFVVTVHAEPLSFMAETAERWQQSDDPAVSRTIGLLVYTLLDAIVDQYFPIIDDISDQIDDLEDRIFEHFDQQTQKDLFSLKKRLLAIRKVVAPERDVLNVLLRRDTPIFSEATLVYLQDVYDHILRVTDAVDTYRDLLASALDVYLTVTSNRLNKVMKTLTASSIILMSMTLVASIYGMNFVNIPELQWVHGYYYALGLMALIGIALSGVFRRIDWF